MNWNFMRMWGANIIIPFKTGNWYDTRLTMMGMQTYQRCDKFLIFHSNEKMDVYAFFGQYIQGKQKPLL